MNKDQSSTDSGGEGARRLFPKIAKTMIVSCGLPPAMNGSSSVIANLAMPFTSDEIVLAGERVPGELPMEWAASRADRAQLEYVHQQWPWRLKRLVRLLLAPIVLIKLLQLYKRSGCKQLVAVYPNEFYLSLGLVASIILRCPFYSYFHNTLAENRSGAIGQSFASALQRAVFRRSQVIFVMSDAIRDLWQASYDGCQFVTLVHSFNGDTSYHQNREGYLPSKRIRIGVMGNVNESNRDAFCRLPSVLKQIPNCHLTICSKLPASYFMSFGFDPTHVTVECPPDPIESTLAQFDLLFLPHGFRGKLSEVEYATIFPTRTIPYLRSGTPIVAHAPANSFIAKWLQKHDCAEVVAVPDSDAICVSINRLMSDEERCNELVGNALHCVKQFRAEHVARRFATFVSGEAQQDDLK